MSQSQRFVIRHENDEFEIELTRRRYSNKTFTWAEVRLGDEWISLGDPWPCLNPKRSELIAAAVGAISYHHEQAKAR